VQEADVVGICNGERVWKTVESVFLKLIVTKFFRKAVYTQRLLFSGHDT